MVDARPMPDASSPSDQTDPAVKSTAPHSAAETASLHPSASMAGADSPAASATPTGTAAGAEAAAGIVDGPDIHLPSDAAALMEAQARVAEYHEAYLRAKAEMENIRRRAQEDIAKTHKYAIENFAEGLVPVIDSLEAALATPAATPEQMRSGVEITLRQLLSAFEKARLTPIDPKGERFDPNRHQAISMVPSADVAAQHVVAVLQKGWVIADRVLKPALVTVSNGAAG